MSALRIPIIAASLISFLSWGPSAFAYELYRWVDENGVTNFSQWRPAEPLSGVTKEILADELPVEVSNGLPGNMNGHEYPRSTHASEMRAVWERLERRRENRHRRKTPAAPPVIVHPEPVEAYAVPLWHAPVRKRPMKPHVEPETPIVSVPFKRPGRE